MTQCFLAWVTLHHRPWLRESGFEHSMRSSTSPSTGTVLFETSTATWPVSGRIHDVWHFLRLGVETVQLTVSPSAQSTTHSSLASFQDWPLVCMRSSLCSLGFVLVFLEQRTCPRSPRPGSWTDPGQVPVDLPVGHSELHAPHFLGPGTPTLWQELFSACRIGTGQLVRIASG